MKDIFYVPKVKLYTAAFLNDLLTVLLGFLIADEAASFITKTMPVNHILENFNLTIIIFGLISLIIIIILSSYALILYRNFRLLEMGFFNPDSFVFFIPSVILSCLIIIFGNVEYFLFIIIFTTIHNSIVSFEILFKLNKHKKMNYIP